MELFAGGQGSQLSLPLESNGNTGNAGKFKQRTHGLPLCMGQILHVTFSSCTQRWVQLVGSIWTPRTVGTELGMIGKLEWRGMSIKSLIFYGRGGGIRTPDPLLPKQVKRFIESC